MNKKILSLLALLLAGAMVFSLTACTITGGGESESTFELTADGKEDSLQLLNEFFEETYGSDNLVVTTKSGDNVTTTESIVGDSGCVVFAESGVTVYSFMQDGAFIGASDNGESKTYRKDEGAYGAYYRFFYAKIRVLDAADESNTFSCVTKTEEKETAETKTSTAELTFEMTGASGTVKITATAKDGLVQSATITDGDETVTQTYAYGSASVTLPDLTDWEDLTNSGPTEEIAD